MLARDLLECYESIAVATREMVAVALAGDWNAVVQVQSRCADLVNKLRQMREPQLDAAQQRRKLDIIEQLLADDAVVRRLIEPRLAELEQMLRGTRQQRKLGAAYGAGASSGQH